MAIDENGLTVAVTGPTGTFGHGLLPLLQGDPRVTTVVGIARHPFDPAAEGWTKLEYRQGDVRDRGALAAAFAGADVVVHLAFVVIGGDRRTTREVNVEGTVGAFRAAAAAGARRFVYASSVAAYGFHLDNPGSMTEQWPVRGADLLSYSQEKAELEDLLQAERARHPELALYLLRPPIVLGPHSVGSKAFLPGPLAPLNKHLQKGLRRVPIPVPVVVPDLPLQFVHEEDVGRALLQCVVGAGPPGAYNIAGDGVVSAVDVARELGLVAIRAPGGPVRRAARALTHLPLLPRRAAWAEVVSNPPVMDTSKAKAELGWQPRFTGIEALRATLSR